ncbi:small conductance mechanosensitive channel MscS2 [Corynebacterium suranareeae]|uniref:Small conductance mechanosensitive channel MscS2 n=1 Tax=Corynebacterium suranareeae TaxID=2506452 RepID=A0A161JML2_9CORY|nr:mechanosensitive ion channel family protein [Corynebacterium suranareeae]BAU96788.1 small conductance mechanosensitive channel MscS2 [Corynebacterium suranareeae]
MVTASTNTENLVQDVSSWWDNPLTQDWLIDKPISIAITLVVAFFAHWLLRKLITKAVERGVKTPPKAEMPRIFGRGGAKKEEIPPEVVIMRKTQEQRRQARIRTLGAVGKSAVAIFVWTWAALTILDKLGLNVAPLIASAGVAGVALGFGAQSLVKDFLSGIFMLIEDQYGVGDTIDVGDGIIGDVEDISLRTTTLRDMDGTVWYVRNGEILRVGNFSNEYAIARFEVPVGLSNDSERAWEVIEQSFLDAVKQDAIKDAVIEVPKMKGISAFEPDHMTFRGVVKTLPGYQWEVQRYVYARVLSDMQREGITTPYPHGMGAVVKQADS